MPTTTPFNNLITFSRGSNATVTGSNGLIQWAPNNLLTFSEQFDNAAWTKSNITVTANNVAAPDGAVNADSIFASGGSAQHFVSQSFSFTAGTAYTLSVFAKKNTLNGVQLTFGSGAFGTFPYANFDVNAGTTAAFNCTSTITDFGNGWYRCTMTATATATISAVSVIGLARDNAEARLAAFSSDGNGILIWGAQLEVGTAATTYNPTTVKNLLGFSEAFDNAAWTKGGASIVTGAQANPVNGLFNAQKLMEDTSTGDHRTFQAVSVTNGTPYVFSAYVKPAGRTLVSLTSVSGALMNVTFDVSTGVITSTTDGVGSIVAVGSGWYRIAVTATATSTVSANFQIRLLNNVPALSYTGDGNSGIYIYGAQLSDSASLDPYVPTPGAAPSSTAYYGPRFDYDPATLQPRGILIEEQRTNLLLRSEEFDTTWVGNQASVTANQTVAPNGTTSGDLVTADGTSAVHNVRQTVTGTAATHTFSVYAKAGTQRYIQLRFSVALGSGVAANFDLQDGTATNSATPPTSSSIQAVGNGWYRCIMTATLLAASGEVQIYAVTDAGAASGQSNTLATNFSLWGAQLEAGAFATSYIPTIASTVTRSADVATITGQNFGQFYRQDEGCFVLDFSVLSTSVNADVMIASTSGSFNPGSSGIYGSNAYQTYVRSGSTYVANFTATGTTTPNTPNKLAYAYSAASVANSFKGGAATSFTPTGTMPTTVNQLSWFGTGVTGTVQSGYIRNIRFIPVRAADFQLQALTT